MSQQVPVDHSVKHYLIKAGVVVVVLGFLAMMAPTVTGLSIGILVGFLVLCAGIVRIYWAFRARQFGRGAMLFALGLLTVIAGAAMVMHPVYAAGVLTMILTVYFLLDGVAEITIANMVKPMRGWGWLMTGGIVSILLGVMIWIQFPLSGAWAIGILLGIKLLLIGFIVIATGLLPQSGH